MKYCPNCGKEINEGADVCLGCGKNINGNVNNSGDGASPKSRLVALLLCFFLGALGVHRFYVGKIGTGILYIFTGGLFGIGLLVDLILIICGTFKDDNGKPLSNWNA